MLYLREVRLLLVVLIILVVIGFMLSYINLMIKANANSQKQIIVYGNAKSLKKKKKSQKAPPYVTEFFAKSIDHAEKVLYTQNYLDGYKNNAPLDLTQLSEGNRKSIVVTMRYLLVDPIIARQSEQKYKFVAEQDKVPFWFVCLWDSIEKTIPSKPLIHNFSDKELQEELNRRKSQVEQKAENAQSQGAKIISISQVA